MSTATLNHPAPFLSVVQHLFADWFAARPQTKPCVATTRTEEAHELRALAYDVAKSDPAFAQDLYAAADRHELG